MKVVSVLISDEDGFKFLSLKTELGEKAFSIITDMIFFKYRNISDNWCYQFGVKLIIL